jgi:uncharacterized protein YuzE
MNIDYDKVADAVYLKVGEGKVANTITVNDRFLVDVDASGKTLGFEILEASSQDGLIKTLEHSVLTGVPVNITNATPAAA